MALLYGAAQIEERRSGGSGEAAGACLQRRKPIRFSGDLRRSADAFGSAGPGARCAWRNSCARKNAGLGRALSASGWHMQLAGAGIKAVEVLTRREAQDARWTNDGNNSPRNWTIWPAGILKS